MAPRRKSTRTTTNVVVVCTNVNAASKLAHDLHHGRADVGTFAEEETGTTAARRTRTSGGPSGLPRPRAERASRGSKASGAPRSAGATNGGTHRERVWSVCLDDGAEYRILESGGKLRAMDEEGNEVWSAVEHDGRYMTGLCTIPAALTAEFLRLIRVGDLANGGERAYKVAAPADGKHAAPKRTPKRTSPEPKAGPAAAKPKSEPAAAKPAKPKGATKPKPASKSEVAPTQAKPVSKRKAEPKTKAAPSTKPPKAAAKRARKPTSEVDTAPMTSRSRREGVSDQEVLAELEGKISPENFPMFKQIWLAGGREESFAWMALHRIPTVVAAFEDWVKQNQAKAAALLQKAPTPRNSRAVAA